ncbi:MAG: class I SAM-dependent methyltransferase [Candidatus Hodarchaeales archaeon]|jgi:cephalosporin hydroxylase
MESLLQLDVGCGGNKGPGWVGMDKRDLPGVDFVHDVEIFPWPIPDNSCGIVQMSHLWEHLDPRKSFSVMDEVWRVLASEGQLWLTMPYGWSHGYVQDPTHINPANETTWEYFDPASPVLYGIYKPKPWKIVKPVQYQFAGNMLVVMEPRKDSKPNPIEIVAKRKEPTTAKLTQADVFEAFHIAQYEERSVRRFKEIPYLPKYKGYEIDKCPYDLWLYMEIIQEKKPDRIIELGTANGGSALFFADQMMHYQSDTELCVITVDIDDGSQDDSQFRVNYGKRPGDIRIKYILGSSTEQGTAFEVSRLVFENEDNPKTMLILDSDHMKEHVFKELMMYSPIVSVGQYLIVEDTNINGNPVFSEYGPGPHEALLDWIPPNDMKFEEVKSKFPFSQNTWLRRMK